MRWFVDARNLNEYFVFFSYFSRLIALEHFIHIIVIFKAENFKVREITFRGILSDCFWFEGFLYVICVMKLNAK